MANGAVFAYFGEKMNQKQQNPTHTNIYPKTKVILAYTFVTPMIRFMILFVGLLTITLLNQQNMNDYGFGLIMVF